MTLVQVFSFEFYEIFKNTFFIEYLWWCVCRLKQDSISTQFKFHATCKFYVQTLGSQTFNNCSYTFSLNDFYSLNSHLYFLDLTVSKKKIKNKTFQKKCCTCFNSSLSMNVARFFLSRIFSDFFCRFTFAMMN